MRANAIVFDRPQSVTLAEVALTEPGPKDAVVDISWSGVSTGTERLFWSGQMPPFPGMGYPLVPGYEAVGRVAVAGADSGLQPGQPVFAPGASGFADVRGLFGGATSRLVSSADRLAPLPEPLYAELGARGVLFALAATAHHAMSGSIAAAPCLIVGHGALGRLLARLASLVNGAAPVVWERDPARRAGSLGYEVIDPADDERRDYRVIFDVSGDVAVIDTLISRLGRGGELVLAGFYSAPVTFDFPPAFMREARLRVAAEWRPSDLRAVIDLVATGRLSLDGLITHHGRPETAAAAYRTAFEDASCLKMILDWRNAE